LDDAGVKFLVLLAVLLEFWPSRAATAAALELEAKIPLGNIHGRIDHLAVDVGRQRLYVAELGNDSVGVVDLKERKLIRTLTGLKEPQGVGYVPSSDSLYVANAGDGSVRIFQGADLVPVGELALGHDADNVRVDDANHRLYVGYAEGALAVIDTQSRRKLADITLKDHPESFQLDPTSGRIFVNVPDANEIAVIDRNVNRQVASWAMKGLAANFPLVLDAAHDGVIVIFRRPARLGLFRARDGQLIAEAITCEDSDDAFLDAARARIYVICGAGAIDVFSSQDKGFSRDARIPTSSGARTGLFVPALDRLFIATRSTLHDSASILVFRPAH
jgi:hypothetical protein